jgi:hypothetical protein
MIREMLPDERHDLVMSSLRKINRRSYVRRLDTGALWLRRCRLLEPRIALAIQYRCDAALSVISTDTEDGEERTE